MRITFVCPPDSLVGGFRVVALYAERLAQRGHQVVTVLPQHRQPSLKERALALVRCGVWLSNGNKNKLTFFRDELFDVRRLRHAGPITDKDVPDADVVIATWWETAEWVWALSESKGVKVHYMQDYEIWGGDAARVNASSALPMPKIVIAQWVWELLEQRWEQTPVALVPCSVDTEKFFAPARRKQAVPTVGLTYTTMHNKGSDVSIAAIKLARRELPGLKVIAFGTSRPTHQLPLPAKTEFHFQVPDEKLRDLYGACDAWLFGTRIEGFGLPILEAMACRTPVIGTPAGAAPQLIGQGGGVLVGFDDVAAMAGAIVRVAQMEDTEWQIMSDAAFRTATTYTWNDATDRFEACLYMLHR